MITHSYPQMRSMLYNAKKLASGGQLKGQEIASGNSTLTESSAADLSAFLMGWERYSDMADLETHFLQPAFTRSVHLSTANTINIIDAAELLQIIGIVSFFLLLLTSFIVLVNPLVSSLDNEVCLMTDGCFLLSNARYLLSTACCLLSLTSFVVLVNPLASSLNNERCLLSAVCCCSPPRSSPIRLSAPSRCCS
jgi:hypothetical protein